MKYNHKSFQVYLIIILSLFFIILDNNKIESNGYYAETFDNPFEMQVTSQPNINSLDTTPNLNLIGSYRDINELMFLRGPINLNSPTTELGKQLTTELLNIQMESVDPFKEKVNAHLVPSTIVATPLFANDSITKKKNKKNKKSKLKKGSAELSILINDSEYFQSVPRELGKAISLNDACKFTPTPIKKFLGDSYWRSIDYSATESNIEKIELPVINEKHPFRSSSECLNLFDESLIAFKKKDLLISPEKFVGLVRQVAMQLRDSLVNPKYVISTEDTCLAMRIILHLPHVFRNVINCKSAIVAAIRDEEEIESYEMLDHFKDNLETKFRDVTFACKSTLKFRDLNLSSITSNVTLKPNQLFKLFRLDITEQDLQFYHRLSLPHRKSALTVQNSYLKYTRTALLYDIAAAIIFLLNELHKVDQSLEQCIEIVITCVSLQEKDNPLNLNPSIYEEMCKDLGIVLVTKRHKVKYNNYTLVRLLKRLTHMEPIFEKSFIVSNTLPSGKTLLPTSEHGFFGRASNMKVWPNIGKVFSDGTVSSSLIPACTGLPAFELNRFIVLNTFIERYLAISGLGGIRLTVEDICLISKYYIAYRNQIESIKKNLDETVMKKEDSIPLAIYRVTQNLNLEIFTLAACKEIYREFIKEEEAALKKVSGFNHREKIEKYYSNPPFSYNSNITLKHLPKMMVNSNSFENSYTWKMLLNNDSCSKLEYHVLNRMILFVTFTLSFWKSRYPSEKTPFRSIFDVCNAFSNNVEDYRFNDRDFVLFSENWILEKDDKKMYSSILESIWNDFIIYERAAFPKISEETEEDYIKRVYHCSLVAEPLFSDEWINIDLPIRMDIAEFIKLLPFIEKPVGLMSNKDNVTINYVTLIKAFLETFFEETYQYPVLVDEKDILVLIDRRELEKKSMDELFFEIQSKKDDWKWLREETAAHAILKLLEYLKTVKDNVEEKIKRNATNKDIYSTPRAIFLHGKWLIKSPQPIFFPANALQRRALNGYPKYIINKARYIQAYFIKAFERVLQFDLNIHIADVIMSLTKCGGDEQKFVELLTDRISNQNGQEFITTQVVKEIHSACITFSFYRYTLKNALSEEQAFAAPRVFYKPKIGWEFFPPNVPDFSRLFVLSKIFKDSEMTEIEQTIKNDDSDPEKKNVLPETYRGKKLALKPYTWSCLKRFLDQRKLEIWQLNRAISMCAYFNHWLYKFSRRENKELQVFNCINAIYYLKNLNGSYTQSDVIQVFAKYIAMPYLKEKEIHEMLSAFNSYELIGKPNSMGKRQWLMNLYRIPQIQETDQNSVKEGFNLLRFPIPPEFGNQSNLYEEQIRQAPEIPKIFIPRTLSENSLFYFKELLDMFTIRYLKRIGITNKELERTKFSISEVIDNCTKENGISLMDGFEQYFKQVSINLPSNLSRKISEAFYKFVILKFSGTYEETFEQIITRISSSRIITDNDDLPFDIPLGIVAGKIDLDLPYNSLSFGEVNFARFIVAYFNEYLIEQSKIRSKVVRNEDNYRINGHFPEFIKEECVAKAFNIIQKGGVDLQQSIEQACSPNFRWLNPKLLRTLVTGLLTYCELNSNNFPKKQGGRNLLNFAKEHFNFPIVSFEETLHTWTMKDIRNPGQGDLNLISHGYSTLESIGEFEQKSGLITFAHFNYCSEMNVSQVNRLIAKLQYYRHCISENSLVVKSDLEKILDMNLWCLSLRQEVPNMRKTHSNLLFNYFSIPGTIKQTFEILEDAFEIVELEWLEKASLKTYKQNLHDSYSIHTNFLLKINSLIKSNKLFCPKILLEDDLRYFQQLFKEKIINRILAFSGFSEIYFREKYGIIFESRPILVATIVDGYRKIESSYSNINVVKSMIPQVTDESIISLFNNFNSYEETLLSGELTSLEEIYKNPICEKVQGSWFFFVPIHSLERSKEKMNVKLSFTETEINRIQTMVAFINQALESKYSDKLKGSVVTFKHIALLFKANIDLSSDANVLYYLHGILQDDLSFSPWLTINVLKSIIKPLLIWEKEEVFKFRNTSLQNNFGASLNKINSKYTNVPVNIINGRWHWYTWCKKPDYQAIIRRVAVLGDEVIHNLTPHEKEIYGIPSIKHMFEVATLYIQYFLQEILYILVPYKPEITMLIFGGETTVGVQIVDFLKSIWEQYLNSYIYKGALPKHDIFHNPIVLVVNKQRFFPLTGFPQLDYFDISLVPNYMNRLEEYYGGYNVGSKYAIHRIVSICAFINLSFKDFISKSKDLKDSEILTNIGVFKILNKKFNIVLSEIKSEILVFFDKEFPFYTNDQEKRTRLIDTIDNYNSFEQSMFNKGWKIEKLYDKPLVLPIQNGYQMNYNLKGYIPNSKSSMS